MTNLQEVSRVVLGLTLTALCLAGAGWFTTQPVAGQESNPQTLHGAAALERLKQDGQYDSLQAAMRHARFNVSRAEATPLGRSAWHAPNPAAGYDAYVTEAGVSIAVNDESYVSLSLHSFGYGAALQTVAPGEVYADKQTINITREGGVREWFVNGPDGLEHGFTLAEPPGARQKGAPLRLALQVSAGWRAVASEDGKLVTLRGAGDQAVDYGKLVVRDHLGRNIAARLTVADEQVVIEVEDHAAEYPLTIDPLFTLQQRLLAADGAAGDYLGYAVALSGDTALVGAPYDDQKRGSAYVFVRSGATWTQQARLNANDGEDGDYFGVAVALEGDTALIGAPNNAVTVGGQGAAYIFKRNGTSWMQQQRLLHGQALADDHFGNAVALSGDKAFIGAYLRDFSSAVPDCGVVFYFIRGATGWMQSSQVFALNPTAGAQFGVSLALSGDTAVVGASRGLFQPGVDQRSAYVFVNLGEWTEVRRLGPELGSATDGFGYAVALDGDTVLVGAYRGDATANDQGAAYAFVLHDSRHVEQQKLFANDGAANDRFGEAVALDGNTLVVGAELDDIGTNADQGSVYVFTRNGTAWAFQQKLTANDGAAADSFGAAVAVSGDMVTVGAYQDDIGGNEDQGSAYIFTRNGTVWTFQQKLTAFGIDGLPRDNFGVAVAFNGLTVVVGAYGKENDRGAVYVFTHNGTVWTQQAKLAANDGAEGDNFGRAVALSGDTLAAGAPRAKVGLNTVQGAAYVFTRTGTAWTQQAKVTANDGAFDDYFGGAVALYGDTLAVGAEGDKIGANVRQGSAYVFTRSGTAWAQHPKLIANDGAAEDNFGGAVALSGDMLVVGASGRTVGTSRQQGVAYVFTRLGSFVQQQKLSASDGREQDRFGYAVAVYADTVAVGALNANIGTNDNQGAAYVFVAPRCPAITIAPGNLPNGVLGLAYEQFFNAVSEADNFAVSGGALPPGLTLSNSGRLSGMPTAAGTYRFAVTATTYPSGCPRSRSYTLTIQACPTITVNPPTLPNGTVGAAYSQVVSATGGLGQHTVAVTAGALPPGLSFNAGGVLSGTPTQAGSFPFTLTATAANGCAATRTYTLAVGCLSLTVTPATLPPARQGAPYSQNLTATGGVVPYRFTVTNGALPPGVSLSTAGVLSGTPTQTGSFEFLVTVQDAGVCAAAKGYTLVVNGCGYTLTPASQSFAASEAAGEVTVTADAGCAWTATSNAPWLTITSGASGSGDGQVSYRVATNTGAARQAALTVAGQTHQVQQAAASGEAPRLMRLTPNAARMGAGGLILNVIGAGFTTSQRVQWNGGNCETGFVSATQLRAVASTCVFNERNRKWLSLTTDAAMDKPLN